MNSLTPDGFSAGRMVMRRGVLSNPSAERTPGLGDEVPADALAHILKRLSLGSRQMHDKQSLHVAP
jgi:hypothetical protein